INTWPLPIWIWLLRVVESAPLTYESSKVEKIFHDKWEHSNRVCLKVIKYTTKKSIRQNIPKNDNAKDFLIAIGEKFTTFEKTQKIASSSSTNGIKKFNYKGKFHCDKKKEG
ncbi:hypothetical protein CR513_26573, partial [Mucuna pruriens]